MKWLRSFRTVTAFKKPAAKQPSSLPSAHPVFLLHPSHHFLHTFKMCDIHKDLCPTPPLLINLKKNNFICPISTVIAFHERIFNRLLVTENHLCALYSKRCCLPWETAEDLAVPFLQEWVISPSSENDMNSSYKGLTPSLETSCLVSTLAPCFPRHTSPAAEAGAAPVFPCIRERPLSLLTVTGAVGSQKSLFRAWGLFCSREHRKEASERTGNHSRTADCSSTSPSGYRLCPISSGLGPGEGNLLTVPLTG